MATATKRRFWQLHLSTLLVVMVELGGLMPLNIAIYHFYYPKLKPGEWVDAQGLVQHPGSIVCGSKHLGPAPFIEVIIIGSTILLMESLARRKETGRNYSDRAELISYFIVSFLAFFAIFCASLPLE